MKLYDEQGNFVVDMPTQYTLPTLSIEPIDGMGMPFKGSINISHMFWKENGQLSFVLQIIQL